MKKLVLALALTLIWSTFVEAKQTQEIKLRATGYYISGKMTAAERAIEGGTKDRFGNKLRPLQDYMFGSYVSIATDPRIIKSGTILTIKEFPNVIFVACDTGSAIRRNRVDICCLTKKQTYELPEYVHATPIAYIHNIQQYPNYGFGDNIARR
ncbi:MAG TPA: 3D domain-containing protein [Methanofastidiosum sp.]|nr:3D domain-containing protein [Methanofastidiosum sp.]